MILQSVRHGPTKAGQNWNRILNQWIPGHSQNPGHNMADKFANRARQLTDRESKPASFASAAAHIHRSTKNGKGEHHRVAQTYRGNSSKCNELCLKSRKEAVIIAQLRAVHSILLAAYKQLLNPDKDNICDLCKEDDQTLEQWLLESPATLTQRKEIFGFNTKGLYVLSTAPEVCLR